MPSLAETQGLFRAAVGGSVPDTLLELLAVPADRHERLAIYQRHHRESFRRHLRGRYPTIEWLLGTDATVALADRLVQIEPPRAPSLAEYGAGLAGLVEAEGERFPPWLADVARLDWLLGRLSVETEQRSADLTLLATICPDALADTRLALQPGLAFLASDWPVDELAHLRLGGAPPERLDFAPLKSWLELRGARGRFSINRLGPGEHAFRQALAAGVTLGEAAQSGLDADAGFEPGQALAGVFAAGLVVAIHSTKERPDV